MKRLALRADCPVLLASRAHGKTRYAGCARCARTVAVSQFTKRAKARRTQDCAPPRLQARRPSPGEEQSAGLFFVRALARRFKITPQPPPAQPFATTWVRTWAKHPRWWMSGRRCTVRALCGAPSSAVLRGGARSALRGLTHRNCLSGVRASERSEFCGAPSRRAAQGSQPAGLTATPSARTVHRLTRRAMQRRGLRQACPEPVEGLSPNGGQLRGVG